MEDKNNSIENNFEDMFSKMERMMMNKLKEKVENTKIKIENLEKSKRKNKEDIISKFKELLEVVNELFEKTKLQMKTQKELINLTEKMGFLDKEIEDLLLKEDGC